MRTGTAHRRLLAAFPGWGPVLAVAGMVVFSALLARAGIPSPSPLDLVWMVLLLELTVVLHEGGHALASLAVGHRLVQVQVGAGPFARFRLSRTRVVIGPIPAGGFVLSISDDPHGFRAKRIVISAAGLLVNAIVLVAVLWSGVGSGPLRDLAIVNGYVLLTNVLPISVKTIVGRQRTDGLALLRTLVAPPSELEEALAASLAVEAMLLVEDGDRDGGREIVRRALQDHPESQSLWSWTGHDHLEGGRYAEARSVYWWLAHPDRTSAPSVRAIHLNNLAWTDLLLDDPDLLGEADWASAQAAAELPKHPAVMGTRAFALVSMGRLRDGTLLAEKAYPKHKVAKDRALVAAVIAIGRARDWRVPEARVWLNRAREHDPDCPLLIRATQEVERRSHPAPGGLVEAR